jgi:signal transduction histidine kinase
MIAASADEVTGALEDLRELARGLHPAILSDHGLRPALEALASRSPCPVELSSVPDDRLPDEVERAAYYVVAEALTNVAKYAEATVATVSVTRRDGTAVVAVSDDGIGGADIGGGTGLRGLADRVEALDGRLTVASSVGKGTTVTAEFPVGNAPT